MLVINENTKLTVTSFEKGTFKLNGQETDSVLLSFKESDTIVQSILATQFNKDVNNRASLIMPNEVIDMGDYIFVQNIATHIKGSNSYIYVFAKDNTSDIVIKALEEKTKKIEANMEYLALMQGVDLDE
ncbi:MAG: hypothetical protein ACI4WU_04770 [Bacilli bacterium]